MHSKLRDSTLTIVAVIGCFFLAIFTHYYKLGSIPQTLRQDVSTDRIVSASFSIILLLFVYLVCYKISHRFLISFCSVLFLILMPWHIEQSRIVSPVTNITLITTILVYLLLIINTSWKKILFLALFIIGLPWLFPGLWIFNENFGSFSLYKWLTNFVAVVSSEFIFFGNNAFGVGSLRIYGVMLWETIPVFILGLYTIVRSVSKYSLRLFFIWFFIPVLIASLNPAYTGLELYIATPLFAIILGYGLAKIYDFAKTSHKYLRILIYIYLLFLLYALTNFVHYYLIHYSIRVGKEANSELKRY